MKKKEKDWLFTKIKYLQKIRKAINKTLEITDIYFDNEMCEWIDDFLEEIHKKIGVKQMTRIKRPGGGYKCYKCGNYVWAENEICFGNHTLVLCEDCVDKIKRGLNEK